jgi:hypothetical protein
MTARRQLHASFLLELCVRPCFPTRFVQWWDSILTAAQNNAICTTTDDAHLKLNVMSANYSVVPDTLIDVPLNRR